MLDFRVLEMTLKSGVKNSGCRALSERLHLLEPQFPEARALDDLAVSGWRQFSCFLTARANHPGKRQEGSGQAERTAGVDAWSCPPPGLAGHHKCLRSLTCGH